MLGDVALIFAVGGPPHGAARERADPEDDEDADGAVSDVVEGRVLVVVVVGVGADSGAEGGGNTLVVGDLKIAAEHFLFLFFVFSEMLL